jgi:hypothetical protein
MIALGTNVLVRFWGSAAEARRALPEREIEAAESLISKQPPGLRAQGPSLCTSVLDSIW